jgi:transcriptional regulator with XRE-family HTH domain
MAMFDNLGPALRLIRELRKRSQADVARRARVGKSQLSKYENGKELPRLDSLQRVLEELGVPAFGFFYTLHLIDKGELAMEGKADPAPLADGQPDAGLLSASTQAAFQATFDHMLVLYKQVLLAQLRCTKGE